MSGIRKLILAALLIPLVALLLLVGLAISEPGMRWIWSRLEPHVAPTLRIESLSGSLAGPLSATGIDIKTPSAELRIREVTLDWNPRALLALVIEVRRLHIDGAHIRLLDSEQPSEPLVLPDRLPDGLRAILHFVLIENVTLVSGDQTHRLRRAFISAQTRRRHWRLTIGELNLPDHGRFSLSTRGHWQDHSLWLDDFKFQQTHTQLTLAGRASCQWPELLCEAELDWAALAWPLKTREWFSESGSLRASGEPAAYEFELAADLLGPPLPRQQLQLSGNGNESGLSAVTLSTHGETGQLDVSGSVRWLPQIEYQATLKGRGLQPEFWLPSWPTQTPVDLTATLTGDESQLTEVELDASAAPGQARYAGQIQWLPELGFGGRLQAKGLDLKAWIPQWPSRLDADLRARMLADGRQQIEIQQADAQGRIRDSQVQLKLRGNLDARQAKVDDGKLQFGDNELKLSGRFGLGDALGQLDTQYTIRGGDLAQLWPGLAGRVSGSGRLSGSLEKPEVKGQFQAQGLRWNEFALQRAKIETDAQWRPGGKVLVQAEFGGAVSGETRIDRLALTANGRPGDLALKLGASSGSLTADSALNMRWDWQQRQASGQLVSGRIEMVEMAPWSLEASQSFSVQQNAYTLSRGCWLGGSGGRACLAGGYDGTRLSADIEILQLPAAVITSMADPRLLVEGHFNAHAHLDPSPLDRLSGRFDIDSQALRLGLRQPREVDNPELLIQTVKVDGRLDAGQLQATAQVRIDQGVIDAEGSLTPDGDSMRLKSRLRLALEDLSFIPLFSPEVVSSSGRLDGDLSLTGTLLEPEPRGQIRLSNGLVALDRPNITLRELRAQVDMKNRKDIELSASTESGGAPIRLEGTLQLTSQGVLAELDLNGDNFLAADTREIQARISPALHASIEPDIIRLKGTVKVPQALIAPHSLDDTGAISPSADQVIANEPEQPKPFKVSSRVRLEVGKDVRFAGFGLTTQIQGELDTRQQPGKLLLANGELRLIEGQYKAYGQDLTIEHGRFIFSGGPLTDPGIDLRAWRRPQPGILVGVSVRGTTRNPEFRLYSDPQMGETDQLSYLVLGRAARARSRSDNASLNNAALALGLKGSDFLAKRFKKQLRLDEVHIGAMPGENVEQAALVLGKYLSPNIYVSYGIGLFEPVSTFRLNYRLSNLWSIETESGVENGGDIFYSVERK